MDEEEKREKRLTESLGGRTREKEREINRGMRGEGGLVFLLLSGAAAWPALTSRAYTIVAFEVCCPES